MQKYKRIQEKRNQRNLLSEYMAILFEKQDYYDYRSYDDSLDWDGVPFDGCNCKKCLFVRMSELKIRLYQKHKNKFAINKLRDFLNI